MANFFSVKRRYALVIDPGGDVPVEVGMGQFRSKRVEEIKARFSNHEFISDTFFNNNKAELLRRGWTLEKIDERMRTATGIDLDYHEVKPPTTEEKEKMADALMAQADELRKEAEKLKSEKVVETPAEKKIHKEQCTDCAYVAEAYGKVAVMNKMRGHRRMMHKELEPSKMKL